jgi:hypothetical protein
MKTPRSAAAGAGVGSAGAGSVGAVTGVGVGSLGARPVGVVFVGTGICPLAATRVGRAAIARGDGA